MDEPTSALSGAEVEVLFRVIRELTAAGVAIVYISHHLEEALEIADDVVVLRDGGLVADRARPTTSTSAGSSTNMVGRNPDDLYPDARAPTSARRCSRSTGLVVADPTNPGRLAVDDLDLTVRAGEIVGLYGLMGAGRTELLETLAGRLPGPDGAVVLDGRTSTHRVDRRADRAAGSRSCPRTASATASCRPMSVGDNLSLAEHRGFVRGPFVAPARSATAVRADDRATSREGVGAGRGDRRRCPAATSRRSSSARCC